MNRMESLDWLRGLLAVSIMLYHLTGWKLHHADASDVLGRLGIYGVSMFFILSGLSMAAGYHAYVRDVPSAARFFVRRLFRIWPMLWLAIAAVSIGGVIFRGHEVDWVLILLNVTTLFGFISPGSYINTGAWSIGNEVVYYALSPAFFWAYRCSLRWGNAATGLTLLLGLHFGLVALSPQSTLASQWQTYIHPLNNLCFYAVGLALFYNLHATVFKPLTSLFFLLTAIALFISIPARDDLISTVTGTNRVAFFIASTLLVLSAYKWTTKPPAWIARPLAALGIATYGVYLLHPVVFPLVEVSARKLTWLSNPFVSMATTGALTIAIALVLYRWFEAPFIQLGKRLTTTPTLQPSARIISPR